MYMKNRSRQLATTGYLAFMFSGVCAISSGVIVSILQEKYGFSYSLSGTLLSILSIGNMLASFAAGILPSKIGTRTTVALLCSGYFIGYLLMAFFGNPGILMGAFLIVGIAKGCTINNCTVLVGQNSKNPAKGMSLMHAFYAIGAMTCPFIITALLAVNNTLPMLGISASGLCLWLVFLSASLPERDKKGNSEKTDFSFLRSPRFWLLTALIFFQNAGEETVTGWLVSYYKSTGILGGSLSTYTVTILWGATLAARLLIAFVIPIHDTFKTLALMGAACSVTYLGLISFKTPVLAIVMLVAFSLAMAGVNPIGMAGIGKRMNQTSVGVLIPVSALSRVIMPSLIGRIADASSLQTAMFFNLIPCIGICIVSLIVRQSKTED